MLLTFKFSFPNNILAKHNCRKFPSPPYYKWQFKSNIISTFLEREKKKAGSRIPISCKIFTLTKEKCKILKQLPDKALKPRYFTMKQCRNYDTGVINNRSQVKQNVLLLHHYTNRTDAYDNCKASPFATPFPK